MTWKRTYKQPIDLEAEYNSQVWVVLLSLVIQVGHLAVVFDKWIPSGKKSWRPVRVLPGWQPWQLLPSKPIPGSLATSCPSMTLCCAVLCSRFMNAAEHVRPDKRAQ